MFRGGHRPGGLQRSLRTGLLVCVLAALGFGLFSATTVLGGTDAAERVIRGTERADKLAGTPGKDVLIGLAGDDWLRGLGGDDTIDGGKGRDVLSGGLGRDRILARDGARDRVYCGLGADRVVADALDRVQADCERKILPPGTPPPPPAPPESRRCSMTDYTKWTWEQCKPGTTITMTNEGWHCKKPLASYGPLPIKVVAISTAAWTDAAPITLNSGCTGSPGTDVNLIVDIRGEGPISPNGSGVDAFKTRVNPQDIRVTGSIQCGRRAPNAHQDAIQLQGGTNITFVNVVAGGDYEAGLSTCQGAGGGVFYSYNQITNVDVLGGEFIGCNKALNGNNAGDGNDVTGAKFRSGRNNGTDPNCTFASSPPCVNTTTLKLRDVVCEQWIGGRWTSVAPK
jgi:RTX calcium-binding nonapeptide repeat (4 copies)